MLGVVGGVIDLVEEVASGEEARPPPTATAAAGSDLAQPRLPPMILSIVKPVPRGEVLLLGVVVVVVTALTSTDVVTGGENWCGGITGGKTTP